MRESHQRPLSRPGDCLVLFGKGCPMSRKRCCSSHLPKLELLPKRVRKPKKRLALLSFYWLAQYRSQNSEVSSTEFPIWLTEIARRKYLLYFDPTFTLKIVASHWRFILGKVRITGNSFWKSSRGENQENVSNNRNAFHTSRLAETKRWNYYWVSLKPILPFGPLIPAT